MGPRQGSLSLSLSRSISIGCILVYGSNLTSSICDPCSIYVYMVCGGCHTFYELSFSFILVLSLMFLLYYQSFFLFLHLGGQGDSHLLVGQIYLLFTFTFIHTSSFLLFYTFLSLFFFVLSMYILFMFPFTSFILLALISYTFMPLFNPSVGILVID